MARIVWAAVVVAIVAAGALVSAFAHPAPPATAGASSGRLPAELVSEAEFDCVQTSGLLRYGNLSVQVAVGGGRVKGFVNRADPSLTGSLDDGAHTFLRVDGNARPDATTAQTSTVRRLLNRCLDRERLDRPVSVRPGAAALLRLYRYHLTVYWPCLRAHGAHPGPVPPFSSYLATSEVARLVPFQTGFQGTDTTALAAARACTFEPDALRDPADG
jgi:hypothetical protein